MEAAPPSYETATVSNVWDLIAPYLDRQDLLAAVLVCRNWHANFTPHLWGNPAVHFPFTDDEDVRFDLKRFLLSLTKSRPEVSSKTHTLCIPRLRDHDEPYSGSWLHTLLLRLPHLQSLVVRGHGSFDHESLVAIKAAPSPTAGPTSSHGLALRLLDASNCENATSSGLADALQRLQQLLYLDLSGTPAARDHRVLSRLFYIHGLKVLKLRSVSLTDTDLNVLAASVQNKVRSLDLRNNKLTDASALILIEKCYAIHTQGEGLDHDGVPLWRSLGPNMLRIYRGVGFETHLRRSLTRGFVPRFIFENTWDSGVTHLYISQNRLSISGLCRLLSKAQLHVLDAGHQHPVLDKSAGQTPDWRELIKALLDSKGSTLTALRIDHRLVTATQPAETPNLPSSLEQQRLALTPTRFHPLHLPHLRNLTLSSLPALSPDDSLSTALLTLLSCIAQTSHLATLAAANDWSRPPGPLSAAARRLFALEALVLEVHDIDTGASEHPDTATLWAAASEDFSFFDNEGAKTSRVGWTDNVAVLAGARADARRRQAVAKEGGYVPGYWAGAVRVRRNAGGEYAEEEADYTARGGVRDTFG